MRKPYHQDERYIDKFKNSSCFTNLTSRILSAARGGNYYGPADGQYTARWQYEPRRKCKCLCKSMCDAIREELYVASTKSCVMIPDHATDWYKKQKQLHDDKVAMKYMTPEQLAKYKCHSYGNFKFESPPAECLDLKPPIRSMSSLPFGVDKSARRISPEFLNLLKQHDMRVRQKSILSLFPPNYTNRRVKEKPQSEPDPCPIRKDSTCVGGKPCICSSKMSMHELKHICFQKSDTSIDRRRLNRKGFFKKWFFTSSDQVYPAEVDNFYCDPVSARSLQHYNRTQPRLRVIPPCPDVCTEDTCPNKTAPSDTTVVPSTLYFPQSHSKWKETCPSERKSRGMLSTASDHRPQYHKHESVQNIWTKPNATEMRDSRVYLGPRFVSHKPEKKEKQICCREIEALAIPCKPKGYVLGKTINPPEMTKTKVLKRKYSCVRKVSHPRFRVQECPMAPQDTVILHANPINDKDVTCYRRMRPRFIPLGPDAKKFDSRCTKRKRIPADEKKPSFIKVPPTRPRYHKLGPLRNPIEPCPTGTDLHPRFHEKPTSTARRGRTLKRSSTQQYVPSVLCFEGERENHVLAKGFPCYTTERFRRKPGAEDTTDDSDGRFNSPSKSKAYHPKVLSTESRSKWADKFDSSRVRVGPCSVRRRSPTALKYRAPLCILKGHETCYKDSTYWAGIPSNYPRPYLERAKAHEKDIQMMKRMRLRMWNTKECPIPKYAPASKCEMALDHRCPGNVPHKALYEPRKRLTKRDASPYHRSCYRSSSGAES